MDSPIKLSESEEMYLVTIRKIVEGRGDTIVPISELAEGLAVLPVSVNQMVKKLAEAGYVQYTPYKGAELTEKGQGITSEILRHRRLWEVFLVKDLKMGIVEADALACRLEHLTSEDVASRLSKFLDDPKVCFHGQPIYPSGNQGDLHGDIPLSQVKVGHPFHILHVEGEESTCTFLADQGVYPGANGCVVAVNASGIALLETGTGDRVTITKDIAKFISIEVLDV
jgi:DtxR family Mn-dependent transcriptional regulator